MTGCDWQNRDAAVGRGERHQKTPPRNNGVGQEASKSRLNGYRKLAVALPFAAAICAPTVAAACATAADAISTDRPDVTNSSQVVPLGSLQAESGVDFMARGGTRAVDGPTIRLRLGVTECFEVLLDLPSYSASLGANASSGFSEVAPAVKRQLPQLPGDIDLAVTAGLGIPIDDRRGAHHDYAPYLQLPWSRELAPAWGISGMATAFLHSFEGPGRSMFESTFVIERQLQSTADLFIEYVGDFPASGRPTHLFNSGGAYRMSSTRQLDLHAGFGLNKGAPDYVIGVGYSVRLDRVPGGGG